MLQLSDERLLVLIWKNFVKIQNVQVNHNIEYNLYTKN